MLQVSFDAVDPTALAQFWAQALPGYAPAPPPPGFADWSEALTAWGVPEELHDSKAVLEGDGPRIMFHRVTEAGDTKAAKNRVHLDLHSGGGQGVPLDEQRRRVRAEAQRLVALGASLFQEHEELGVVWAVMTDPEGNEFCA